MLYVTKYALSSGILAFEKYSVERKNSDIDAGIEREYFSVTNGVVMKSFKKDVDAFEDKKKAIRRFEQMRERKIKLLEKQIEKLRNMGEPKIEKCV